MSVTTEPGSLGPQTALFAHALRLHQQDPDSPLPRDGEPYPDDELHRCRRQRLQARKDQRLRGVDVAAILDMHFGKVDAQPSELADAFCEADVPIHHNEHIAAAALRADRQRVRQTGRWLLRHACDGDYLNGYFAGQVATAAHLHEAIIKSEADDDLVDHTGRLLKIMADCGGMGMTLENYPPAPHVLAAYAAHLGRQAPAVDRYVDAAVIADHLADKTPQRSGCTNEQRDHLVRQYLAVLDRPDWCDSVRAGLDADSEFVAWFAGNPAARLHLRAFADLTGDDR